MIGLLFRLVRASDSSPIFGKLTSETSMLCLPVLILYSAAYVSWNFDFSRPTRGPPRLLHASPVLLTFSIEILDVPCEHGSQEIAVILALLL